MVFINDIVKVLVVAGDGDSAATRTVDSKTGKISYHGFHIDVWNRVVVKLSEKYEFVTSYTDENDRNYNSYVDKVYAGEYDIVVGHFFRTSWREERINYTNPLTIDANAIIHKNNTNTIGKMKVVLWKCSGIMITLLIFGLIIGLLIFWIDPNRVVNMPHLKNKQRLFLYRSMLTGIATVVGEMGYLSENASLEKSGIILVIIIMSVSFVFIMFMQAEVTRILIQNTSRKLTKDNLSNMTLLGIKGYSTVEKLKKIGGSVDMFDTSSDKLIDKYLVGDKNYDGVILSYIDAFTYAKQNHDLTITMDFGYEPACWIVNQAKKRFLEDVNQVLAELTASTEVQRICHSYFGNIIDVPVCSLA